MNATDDVSDMAFDVWADIFGKHRFAGNICAVQWVHQESVCVSLATV